MGRSSSSTIGRGEAARFALFDLPPVRIGLQAEITDGDLSLVGDMGSDPGDELQIIHPLLLCGVTKNMVVSMPKD
jgi:hypothetical protein